MRLSYISNICQSLRSKQLFAIHKFHMRMPSYFAINEELDLLRYAPFVEELRSFYPNLMPLDSLEENMRNENDSEEKPDTGLMNDSLRREVQRALSTLTQREADVITLYFGLNGEHSMTLEEIGEKFNLTRERVRQIKEKAIRRLRHTSRSKALKPYLG